MQDEIDAETLKKIHQAQSLRGIPPEKRLVKWKNIGQALTTRAKKTPDKTFLIYCNDDTGVRREYTYSQFDNLVSRVANFLKGTIGIGKQDRVGTAMYNDSDTVAAYIACWKLGAAVVPVNVEEDDERTTFTFNNAQVKAVFIREEYVDRIMALAPKMPGVRAYISVGEKRFEGIYHSDSEVAKASPELDLDYETSLDDEALIIYTSGTTGKPKGVVLTQYNLLVDPDSIAKWHRIDSNQRMMCILPIHHVNGIVVTLMTPLHAGASVVLNRRFSPKRFWARIAQEKVHIVSLVPTVLSFLLEANEDISKYDLKHFRHVISGAGTLAIKLGADWEDRFGFPIIHGYGLSETTCYDCFLPTDLSDKEHKSWMRDYGYPSIGVPIECNEMAIHDENGNPLTEGKRGEIVIRGHLIMKYYYRRPDANADTFKYGWFRSGDEGFYKLDDKGRQFFFITGRLKELINRGGVKYSPFEIEEVLNSIPGVKVGLAISFPNKWYGEEVGAYIVPQESASLSEKDVLTYCRARMPFSKCPKVVKFDTEVPVTSTGKYQRLKLRDSFKEYEETQFREK